MKKKKELWKRPNYKGTPYQVFFRKMAVSVTKPLLKTSITPNQVTTISIFLSIIPAYLLYRESVALNILAVAFIYLLHILDKVDGQIAREKGMQSNKGIFLDGIFHNVLFVALMLGLGLRYYYVFPAAFFSSIGIIIFGLIHNFNYINRIRIVGTDQDKHENILKIDSIPRKGAYGLLLNIYYIPGQNFPEILLLAIISGLIPYMLMLYLLYYGFNFFAYAFILSRF